MLTAAGDHDEATLGAIGPVDRQAVGFAADADCYMHLADEFLAVIYGDVVVTICG